MTSRFVKYLFLAFLGAMFTYILFSCVQTASMVKKHPTDVGKAPICSKCHTDGRGALNHTSDFDVRHKFYARQQSQSCELCHRPSFCADCHTHKEEIKPSDKYKDSPERTLPHRGDYLSQHKIDGRINPASCFPCHGRQNNSRCRTCHR